MKNQFIAHRMLDKFFYQARSTSRHTHADSISRVLC